MLLQKHKNFYNNILFYTWKKGASQTYDTPSGEKLRFNLLQPLLNTKARILFSYTRKIPVPENRGIKEAVNTYIVLSAVDVIIISSPYPWQELTQKALTMAVKTVIAKLIIFFKLIRIIFY